MPITHSLSTRLEECSRMDRKSRPVTVILVTLFYRLAKLYLSWLEKKWMYRLPAGWVKFKRQEIKTFRQNMKHVLSQEQIEIFADILELRYRQHELEGLEDKRQFLKKADLELAERFHTIITQIETQYPDRRNSKCEGWATALGWFIPRKYRSDIIGDLLEDCAEMREAGCTERRIKFHVVYQWLIAVITLVPTAVKTSIIDAVKQVLSPPK